MWPQSQRDRHLEFITLRERFELERTHPACRPVVQTEVQRVTETMQLPDGRVAERCTETIQMHSGVIPPQLPKIDTGEVHPVRGCLSAIAIFVLISMGFAALGGSVWVWWVVGFIAWLLVL